jgi:hypothetical protein
MAGPATRVSLMQQKVKAPEDCEHQSLVIVFIKRGTLRMLSVHFRFDHSHNVQHSSRAIDSFLPLAHAKLLGIFLQHFTLGGRICSLEVSAHMQVPLNFSIKAILH